MKSLEPGAAGRPLAVELFLDGADTLRSVACHTLYVVPTPLLHSPAVADLGYRFDATPRVLPMVPVFTRDHQPCEPGIAKLVEMIERRMRYAGVDPAFDSPETMRRLAIASGGYVRNLVALARSAVVGSGHLPVTGDFVADAIRDDRNAAELAAARADLQEALREVAQTQRIQNTTAYLELLENFLLSKIRDRVESL